jgi:hypothetical protein
MLEDRAGRVALCCHLCSLPAGIGFPETPKKAFRLDSLQQPGNRPEEFEGTENQAIVAAMIRADLAQADHPEASGPRDRKRLHNPVGVEVAVVLAPVDFCP